jgi:hypothetical protein
VIQQKDCIKFERNIWRNLIFLSYHKRKSNNDIKIYHIFFDLT